MESRRERADRRHKETSPAHIGSSPEPNIPELTDQYHKARRNYGIFAALLLVWEFIGVDIPADATHKLLGFEFNLKSPAGAEVALILLTLYAALRFAVEWNQCNPARRAMFWSKLDYYFAHLLGAIALALYGYQRISGLQFSDETSGLLFVGITLIFSIFAFSGMLWDTWEHRKNGNLPLLYHMLMGGIIIMLISLVVILFRVIY